MDRAQHSALARWIVPCLIIQTPFILLFIAVADLRGLATVGIVAAGLGVAGLASRISNQAAVGASAVVAFLVFMIAYAVATGALSIG